MGARRMECEDDEGGVRRMSGRRRVRALKDADGVVLEC